MENYYIIFPGIHTRSTEKNLIKESISRDSTFLSNKIYRTENWINIKYILKLDQILYFIFIDENECGKSNIEHARSRRFDFYAMFANGIT